MTGDRKHSKEDQPGDAAVAVSERLAEGDTDGAVARARTLHPAELAGVLSALESEQRAGLLARLRPDELRRSSVTSSPTSGRRSIKVAPRWS